MQFNAAHKVERLRRKVLPIRFFMIREWTEKTYGETRIQIRENASVLPGMKRKTAPFVPFCGILLYARKRKTAEKSQEGMKVKMERMPLIWAHRGASGTAPENTLPAFRLADREKCYQFFASP